MAELAILLYYLFNLAFLWSFGSLLTVKSIKRKFDNVTFFGFAFLINALFFAIRFIYSVFEIQAGKVFVSEIAYVASFLPGIIFLKKTFYAKKKSAIVLVIATIYTMAASLSILASAMEEAGLEVVAFRMARYIMDDLVISPLIFTWSIVNGIQAYLQNANITTRFVRLRFVYFALGHAAVIVVSILDFFSGIVHPALYDIYAPVSVIGAVLYGLFMYLTWFPPTWLYKGTLELVPRTPIASTEGSVRPESSIGVQAIGSTAGRSQKMRVIEHFGKILSQFIGKNPSACSGLILICIEELLGPDSAFRMEIKDLRTVLSDGLPKKLDMLGVPGAKEAVVAMQQELATNVSLMTMSMF